LSVFLPGALTRFEFAGNEKAKGTLEPFDPSAPNVHERSRVKITRALETARSSISGSTIPAETDTDFEAGVTQSDESEDYEAESNGRGKTIIHFLFGGD
jgi:hypothetical protein